MARKTPVPIRCPESIFRLAADAQLDESTPTAKMVLLLNHFLRHQVPAIDMSNVDTSAQRHQFTLRLTKSETDSLDSYCRKTLYSRQQAFQIAMMASLSDLGLLTDE